MLQQEDVWSMFLSIFILLIALRSALEGYNATVFAYGIFRC